MTYGSSYGNMIRGNQSVFQTVIAMVMAIGLVAGLIAWIIYLLNGGMQGGIMCPPGTKEAHGFSGSGYVYLCIDQ